ncbi:MAG TPA: SDR family NAD(P)-dependent oxidoreductase [Edaphocola sp.]|nr:SDR family NAD(P)-dependent oxidoreductase [Edaphocola sp.]
METKKSVFALVTGAGRGLGRAFATELARRGHNVLMTALPGENLSAFCAALQSDYKVKAACFECDLTQENEIARLTGWIEENYALNILINNAGIGGTSEFEKTQACFINNMILLNVRAMTLLTHQLLPVMRRQKQAWILNVSSMASFSPIGYKTVYPATKVFILNFSRGLYQELKGSGVFVSVVHPGPMKTNADTAMRIEKQGWRGQVGLIAPGEMARRSLDRLFRKDSLILVGWMNKMNWLLMKTVPVWIRLPLITNIVRKEILSSKEKINEHESIGNRRQQFTGRECDYSVAG